MSTASIMLVLGFTYFLAHLFQFIFQRFRIPDVLLFMLIGLVLGPLTGFVDKESFGRSGEALSTLALVLILFDSGVNLDLKAIRASWAQTLGITLLTAFATGLVFFGVGRALGLSTDLSMILGAVLCGTSSAVVIPMIQSLRLDSKTGTIATIESALTDVLCIVLTGAFIDAYVSGKFSAQTIAASVSVSMGGAMIMGLILGFVWFHASQHTQKLPNTALATLAFGLLVYGIAEFFGLSGGITVMAFGFSLANSQLITKQDFGINETERKVYSELIFILKTFFFIFLGTSLVFKNLPIALVSLAGTLLIFGLRLIITRFTAPKSMALRDRGYLSLLIPKGLAAAVLAGIPAQKGIPGAEKIQLIVFSVVFFSILVCALFIPFVERPKALDFLAKFFKAENPNSPRN